MHAGARPDVATGGGRPATVALTLALALCGTAASGCFVSVPLEGKDCNDEHPCESGYWCDEGLCREGAEPSGEGGEAEPCRPDGTCDPGLRCLSNVCVRLDDEDAGPGPDEDAGPGVDAGYDAGPLEDPLAGIFGEGVVGYWSFNEDRDGGIADYSRNGLDGFARGQDDGGVGGPQKVIGTYFRGARFDGVDDYYEIPDSPALDLGTGGFSLETWVRTSSPCTLELAYVSRWSPGMLWFLSCWASEGEAAGGRAVVGVRDSENFAISFAGDTVINDGDWHHVMAVKEETRVVLYVDGTPDGSQDASFFGNFNAASPLNIGRYNADGRYIVGDVDEVRVWNRALTPAEVARTYATFKPGLRGHWAFERSLRNLGGALYPATVTGGAVFSFGQRGVGISLDGENDTLLVSDYPQTAYTQDYTFSLWFRLDATTDAGVQLLNNEVTSRSPLNVWFDPAEMHAHVRAESGAIVETTLPGDYDDGEWHHVVVSRQGTDNSTVTMTLWVDGVIGTPAAGDVDVTETGLQLRVGARAIGDARRFAGDVDELQVYNRALTDAEVQLLYSSNR